MTHLRKIIRDAVVARVTNLTTTEMRVYKSRNLPLTATELPALCVFARMDRPDYDAPSAMGLPAIARVIELHIQGYVKDSDATTIEDTLDEIAEEVETAMYLTPFAGLQAVQLGEQTIEAEDSGDETLGMIDMVFNVTYRAAEGAPGTAT